MKAIVCEMCSSHDVVKQDGYYVCQSCGTKYTTEDAKKLMVEVEGTIKVDQSDAMNNYLALARQARREGNSENAAKYYELVKTIDANNWEAYFYSTYYKAASSKLISLTEVSNNVSNCIPHTLDLIKKSVPAQQQRIACSEIATSIRNLRKSFVETSQMHYNQFRSVEGSGAENIMRARAAYNMEFTTGNAIYDMFGFKDIALPLLKDCTDYEWSYMDATEVSNAIAKMDRTAAVESMNASKAEAMRFSRRWLVISIFAILLGVFVGILMHSFGAFSWICIGIGVLFLILYFIELYSQNKKIKDFTNKN